MHSDRLTACFADIVSAIKLIQGWVQDAGGVEQVEHDILIRSAIERQLLVISEAAGRLHKLDSVAEVELVPDIDWAGIRGIGNFIRHKYDGLDHAIVADVLRNRLTALRIAVEAALDTLGSRKT